MLCINSHTHTHTLTEVLTLSATHDVTNDWEKDYEEFVEPLIEENTPCYIFFRLDKKTSIGYEWLLISYTPDTAKIREKMLYASTKATLKKEFGSPHIKEEYHATSQVFPIIIRRIQSIS